MPVCWWAPCCREGAGDLPDAEWERLRPFLPVKNRRREPCRDHQQVIDGVLHRVRTGMQWRDLPERFGPRKTLYDLTARTSPRSACPRPGDFHHGAELPGGLGRLSDHEDL
ncbi:transposase [Streptomyces angustmyceticus]|uniref:transposase n=1 Tax=Streptomyces angustmyceticus TaxID=285578 RepID=UPI00344CD0B8